MKTVPLILIFVVVLLANGFAQTDDKVEEIEKYDNLFRYKNWYLGGQPNLEQMDWLLSQGVTKIVTLRTKSENEDFEETAFDEKSIAEKLGIEFVNVPISGYSDYTPEHLDEVIKEINSDEKVLLHCGSAGRVTYFFMGYLVRSQGYSLDDAIEIGKQLKYYNPMEDLLGNKIEMKLDK
jgi:protein tyrosine phosphatase (PTP) superfamily phosphohydrolase (DUF442 family)